MSMTGLDVKSVKAISGLEKGGLFVILVLVLVMGYQIFLKSKEQDDKLIISQLAAISQQQITLQQSLTNMHTAVADNTDATKDVMRKIETIENTMVQFVYVDSTHLMLRAPAAQGGAAIKIQLKEQK